MSPQRLSRWIDGFIARNGEIAEVLQDSDSVRLRTVRNGVARIFAQLPETAAPDLDSLYSWVSRPRHFAVVLVRRGGYAAGDVVFDGTTATISASKNGTRYVQGRTAAGGQSQQRFARRRANQTDSVVQAARDAAVGILGITPRDAELVTGGDAAMIDQTLADPRLAWLRSLTRINVDVADPRKRTLTEAIERATAVHIEVQNAPTA